MCLHTSTSKMLIQQKWQPNGDRPRRHVPCKGVCAEAAPRRQPLELSRGWKLPRRLIATCHGRRLPQCPATLVMSPSCLPSMPASCLSSTTRQRHNGLVSTGGAVRLSRTVSGTGVAPVTTPYEKDGLTGLPRGADQRPPPRNHLGMEHHIEGPAGEQIPVAPRRLAWLGFDTCKVQLRTQRCTRCECLLVLVQAATGRRHLVDETPRAGAAVESGCRGYAVLDASKQ